jgi:replicative DNA helicase
VKSQEDGQFSFSNDVLWCVLQQTRGGKQVDIERTYLSKIAQTGQIEKAIASGIRESHFEDEHLTDIFSYMAEHARKYKGAPSLEVIRERFPDYNFETTTDSVEYLRERFVRNVKRRFAMNSLKELAKLVNDPEQADRIDGLFLEESRRLATIIPSTQLHKFSDIEQRIEKYETSNSDLIGIKMGIPDFDRLTLGIQRHEFVSIVGWQGTGKSTLTQWILFNAWMHGHTAMCISLEMEAAALMRKWDTMLTNFEYRALKAHELAPHDVESWRIKAQQVKEKKCDIIVRDDVRDCTVDYVYSQAMRYQPDIIAVDYISLMEAPRTAGGQMWEKVTNITQSLKQIARVTGIPIIGVAQTNIASAEGGAKLDNIAYSRSVGQDSDIVLGLHQDEEMKENDKMTVRMLKNRDGNSAVADLLWDMDHMRFMPWNEVEFFKNRQKRLEAVPENDEPPTYKIDSMTGEIIDD